MDDDDDEDEDDGGSGGDDGDEDFFSLFCQVACFISLFCFAFYDDDDDDDAVHYIADRDTIDEYM